MMLYQWIPVYPVLKYFHLLLMPPNKLMREYFLIK